MRVKKFEAKSMKEALQMVKKELGPDAVILGARDNRKSFGLGGEASVEITAAVSESTLQKKRFVESRMTANDRARFERSDARTQRQIIDRMVDNRTRASEEKPRRPITSVSYIDIPDDDVEPTPRRNAALDRAAGRSVSDLLEDFDRDFVEEESWQQRPTREAASNQEPSERALSRIKNAAREAWRNNPFLEDEQAAQESRANRQSAQARQAAGASNSQRAAAGQGGYGSQAPTRSGSQQAATRAQQGRDPRTQSVSGGGGLEMIRESATNVSPQAQVSTQVSTQGPASEPPKDHEISVLKGEINRLQQMLEGFQKVPQSFATMHPGADYGIPYDLSFMYQKLIEAGVTVDNTVDILQLAAKELDPVAMKKRPIVDAWVARWFLNSIHVTQTPWQGRLHLFVGGAGSGKTTALVKMASHLVVKEKKKVAILTTDSFKVGAVDQLKIYCQILNVPFAVLRNRKDWEWVLSQLHHVDHILVDFPGLQLRDLEEIHLLKSLLPPEGNAPVTHLCVSATTKDGDAYEVARRYKVADFADLVVTNLDQSVQHGIIHNIQKKTGKPLHSFGTGSRVPEDFEAASKERVLDLIFKISKMRRETR